MTSSVNLYLSQYNSMSTDDQAAVRWGIWVLEGMQEEPGFSERIISTNPSCPSIEKAVKLFEANGKNITPSQVKEDVHKMKHGIDAVHIGLSGKYNIATQAIMSISPLTKEILSAVLIKKGHASDAGKLGNNNLIYQAMCNHETTNIYQAVLRMYNKITD